MVFILPHLQEQCQDQNEGLYGFRANRATTDMVFIIRHLQEKCHDQGEGIYGFRANRAKTDMVFNLRHLPEQCQDQNEGLYAIFADLMKTFHFSFDVSLGKIEVLHQCIPQVEYRQPNVTIGDVKVK